MNKVKKFLAIIENLIFMIFCMIVILFLVLLISEAMILSTGIILKASNVKQRKKVESAIRLNKSSTFFSSPKNTGI